MKVENRIRLLFSQLKDRLNNNDLETFNAISNRIHEISDKQGLTSEEYKIYDNYRDKANDIQLKIWESTHCKF